MGGQATEWRETREVILQYPSTNIHGMTSSGQLWNCNAHYHFPILKDDLRVLFLVFCCCFKVNSSIFVIYNNATNVHCVKNMTHWISSCRFEHFHPFACSLYCLLYCFYFMFLFIFYVIIGSKMPNKGFYYIYIYIYVYIY